jgi:hypothetical protein
MDGVYIWPSLNGAQEAGSQPGLGGPEELERERCRQRMS